MKRKRHTPQQVVRELQEAQASLAAGRELAAVCQMLGVSEKTYYRWRSKYGGMKAEEAKRLAAIRAGIGPRPYKAQAGAGRRRLATAPPVDRPYQSVDEVLCRRGRGISDRSQEDKRR